MAKHNKKEEPKTKAEPITPQQEITNAAATWKENIKYVQKTFPGPQNSMVPLRIAIDREAFVKVTEHVMKSIDEEVCGVLVGDVCEDGEGFFVHVRNIIKGITAHQGGAHVTFTHETWNQIHDQLENDFPDWGILGWYHSHPGFGVLFSEMDLFIQQNFFPSPTQFALVMDPLGGEKALCVNVSGDIHYIDKFWVDGREYRAFRAETGSPENAEFASSTNMEKSLTLVEIRLNQVLSALDKLSLSIYRVLTVMISLFLLIIIFLIFYSLFINTDKNNRPPEVLQYVPVPVKIGDKEVLLGVAVIDWKVPPELNAYFKKIQDNSDSKTNNDNTDKKKNKNFFQRVIEGIKNIFKKEPLKKTNRNDSITKNPGSNQQKGKDNDNNK